MFFRNRLIYRLIYRLISYIAMGLMGLTTLASGIDYRAVYLSRLKTTENLQI